jgi:hypothetical protein
MSVCCEKEIYEFLRFGYRPVFKLAKPFTYFYYEAGGIEFISHNTCFINALSSIYIACYGVVSY